MKFIEIAQQFLEILKLAILMNLEVWNTETK